MEEKKPADAPVPSRRRRILRRIGIGTLVLFVLIQAVPYGRNHTNPPVVQEPKWDSPTTRALAVRTCFDCHSNESHWPWYSHVAPASWLVQNHVDEGRRRMNFSEFQRSQKRAANAAEEYESEDMPVEGYTWLHAEARLSDAERTQLLEGLKATLGKK